MPRPLVLIVLVLCLLWQAVASVHAAVAPAGAGGLDHSQLHWDAIGHQHHADGGIQLDDGDEAVAHALGDHLCCSSAPPASSPQLPTLPMSDRLPAAVEVPVPAPDPERLLRPPRA